MSLVNARHRSCCALSLASLQSVNCRQPLHGSRFSTAPSDLEVRGTFTSEDITVSFRRDLQCECVWRLAPSAHLLPIPCPLRLFTLPLRGMGHGSPLGLFRCHHSGPGLGSHSCSEVEEAGQNSLLLPLPGSAVGKAAVVVEEGVQGAD